MATKSINSLIIDACQKYINGDTSVFNAETSTGIQVNNSDGDPVLTLAADGSAIELAEFSASLASILSFTPTGVSYFDQREYKDIIRKGEPGRSYYTEAASATRGSRKEMPLQGIVAWNATNVAIIDTEFGEPTMWRSQTRAASGTSSADAWPSDSTAADAAMVCGLLSVALNNGTSDARAGVLTLDFLSGQAGRYSDTAADGGVAQSLDLDAGDLSNTLPVIVNGTVNSVAISPPLDHYPLDQYGRPAFDIACGTNGGVSVILPDADNRGKRVTDSSTITFIDTVDWDDDRLYFSRLDFGRFATVTLSEIEAGDGWGSASLTGANDFTTSSTPALPDNTKNCPSVVGRDLLAFRGDGATVNTAMGFVAPNRVNRDGSLVALLTSTSLSGWMPGDCKLALDFNAYAAGSVAASTPLDDDFTSYADQAAAEAAGYVASGATPPTFDAVNDQWDFPGVDFVFLNFEGVAGLADGETYSIAVNWSGSSAGSLRVQYGAVNAGQVSHSDGSISVTITWATGSSIRLQSVGTFDGSIDSIIIKRAYPDLSPANNGAILNGALTAAAVETGADLFALSGFSAANYLEVPYSSDLDFGTGDFELRAWAKLNATVLNDAFMRYGDGTSDPGRWVFGPTIGDEWQFSIGPTQIVSGAALLNVWQYVVVQRRDGTINLWIDGVLVDSALGATDLTVSGGAPLYLFDSPTLPTFNGEAALPRVTKGYASTPDQIRRMYEDEKKLFEPGAKCFLPSDTVNSLDARDGLLAIGTEGGAVIHDGFKRLELLDSGDIGLTESGVDSVALLGGNDISAVTGTEGVARLAARNLAEAQVVDAYGYERNFAGKGYTTDATPLDIAKLPLAEGDLIEWRGSITARSDDGTERASYTRVVRAYRDVNGNATLAGADTLGTDDETTAGMDVAFAADTTAQTIDLQVTGVASTNIQWSYSGTLTVNKQ